MTYSEMPSFVQVSDVLGYFNLPSSVLVVEWNLLSGLSFLVFPLSGGNMEII